MRIKATEKDGVITVDATEHINIDIGNGMSVRLYAVEGRDPELSIDGAMLDPIGAGQFALKPNMR